METLERILYAEDEADIREVAMLALESLGGYSLKVCQTGLEAVAEIAGFNPQLLLFDVMMPELDGPGALKKIREIEAFSNTPIIFMTAKVQPTEVQKYLDMGAADVIAKPFDPMTLAERIRDIWQKIGD